MFVILSINLSDLTLSCWAVSFLWTRFYNNAAEIFDVIVFLRRRLMKLIFEKVYNACRRY